MPARASPNRSTPYVEAGLLHLPTRTKADIRKVRVGGSDWKRWLATASKFYVKVPAGGNGFFCRKDVRAGGSAYWSAFQRRAGQVARVYLGKDTEVTMKKLIEVTDRLATQAGEPQAPAGPVTAIGEPQIESVRFSKGNILFDLADGRIISTPLEWFPRLKNASVAQRQNFYVAETRTGVHWPDVDEDISVRVLMGLPS